MPENNEQEQLSKLIGIIQQALQRDEQLRQTYQVGEKFRFIRERLNSLLENIQKETQTTGKKEKTVKEFQLEEDEMLVYIHLYNAQGSVVRTWQALLTPRAFFDFSVNRPLYSDQKQIEAFIQSKSNKVQHAFLTIAMKKERVLSTPEESVKDTLGSPLIRVKEGSLRFDRVSSFTHNEINYTIDEEGNLIKK